MRITFKQNKDFERADYHGFTLKKDFFYGVTCRGQYAASSGWDDRSPWEIADMYIRNDTFYHMAVYIKKETGWKLYWIPIDRIKFLEV